MKWLIIIACLGVVGCHSDGVPQYDTFHANGIIYVWPRGTVSIIDEYDHLWYPLNLPDSLHIARLRLSFRFDPVEVGTCPSFEEGYPIHIISIEEIK